MNQNKTWKAWNMRMFLLLLCIGIFYSVAAANTSTEDWPADVVEAFRTSPVVQSEISRIRKSINAKESTEEDIKIIGLGGGCGVAGCGASYLAVITVHRRGVNPQSASVLATVHRPPRGALGRVKVVELKEKGQPETSLEILRRYSSPSPTIERK